MVGFTPVEEVQLSLEVQWGMAEKEAKDFFREEWVEDHGITILKEDLEEVVDHMELMEVLEEAAATLEGAADKISTVPVGEAEDPIMLERIRRMYVATIQLDMVK